MRKIKFTKMVASGNDFIVVDSGIEGNLASAARYLCDRKFGIGGDGLLLLESSRRANVRMRIFNADGSEAQMCGNGARCIALYVGRKEVLIETKAGLIGAEVNADAIKIKLTSPKSIKLDIPIKINKRLLKVNFVNTGVPHTVIFVEDADKIDVANLGRNIRHHNAFSPGGTNVDFVEVLSNDSIKVRTYERGVEDETLACGTGSVASAVIFASKCRTSGKIDVHTKGKEALRVYFVKKGKTFEDVCLEGKARVVFFGVCSF